MSGRPRYPFVRRGLYEENNEGPSVHVAQAGVDSVHPVASVREARSWLDNVHASPDFKDQTRPHQQEDRYIRKKDKKRSVQSNPEVHGNISIETPSFKDQVAGDPRLVRSSRQKGRGGAASSRSTSVTADESADSVRAVPLPPLQRHSGSPHRSRPPQHLPRDNPITDPIDEENNRADRKSGQQDNNRPCWVWSVIGLVGILLVAGAVVLGIVLTGGSDIAPSTVTTPDLGPSQEPPTDATTRPGLVPTLMPTSSVAGPPLELTQQPVAPVATISPTVAVASPTVSPTSKPTISPTGPQIRVFTNTQDLLAAVDLHMSDPSQTLEYGATIGDWDVSRIRDFRNLFNANRGQPIPCEGALCNPAFGFNEDLSRWNTSSAVAMDFMFAGEDRFNQDISNWDVSRVSGMYAMFLNALDFNQDLSRWNVESAERLGFMFRDAASFNQDLASWNVSNVQSMESMFEFAYSFNGDISRWDVGRVEQMEFMFHNASSFNRGLANWNVGQVKDASSMFSSASAFNQDISRWNTQSLVTTRAMFRAATSFNQGLSAWNVGKVTNTDFMFREARFFNQDLSGWDLRSAVQMTSMFEQAEAFNGDVSGWQLGRVSTIEFIFTRATSFNRDLSSWDVSSVRNMKAAFALANAFNGDVTSWNVGAVTNMDRLFIDANAFNQDVASWDVGSVTVMREMFKYADSFDQDVSSWQVGNVADAGEMFNHADRFNTNLCDWLTRLSSGTNATSMFSSTACPNPSDPVLPSGPMCHDC